MSLRSGLRAALVFVAAIVLAMATSYVKAATDTTTFHANPGSYTSTVTVTLTF